MKTPKNKNTHNQHQKKSACGSVCACVGACVCVCVCSCVRACVCARVCARVVRVLCCVVCCLLCVVCCVLCCVVSVCCVCAVCVVSVCCLCVSVSVCVGAGGSGFFPRFFFFFSGLFADFPVFFRDVRRIFGGFSEGGRRGVGRFFFSVCFEGGEGKGGFVFFYFFRLIVVVFSFLRSFLDESMLSRGHSLLCFQSVLFR